MASFDTALHPNVVTNGAVDITLSSCQLDRLSTGLIQRVVASIPGFVSTYVGDIFRTKPSARSQLLEALINAAGNHLLICVFKIFASQLSSFP